MAKQEKFNLVIGAKDKTGKAIGGIQRSIAGMAAGFLSAAAAAKIFKFALAAALEHEAAYNDLRAAIERTGASWAQLEKGIRAFTDRVQRLTSISDEKVARSMQLLLDYGMGVGEAMQALNVAMDLAAARSLDLQMAVDLLGKAYVGYTGTLSRYGIIIDQTLTQSEKYGAALHMIMASMGGAAQAKMEATVSQFALFKQILGDLAEIMALPLLPTMKNVAQAWNQLAFVTMNTNRSFGDLYEIMVKYSAVFQEVYKQTVKEQKALVDSTILLEKQIELRRLQGETIMVADQGLSHFRTLLGEETTATRTAIHAIEAKIKILKEAIESEKKRAIALKISAAAQEAAYGIEATTRITTYFEKLREQRKPEVMGFTPEEKAAIDERARQYEDATKAMLDMQMEFINAVQTSFSIAADGIVDILWGVDRTFSEVLNSMLKNFVRMLVQMAMRRLAFSILGLTPGGAVGGGGLLGLIGLGRPAEAATTAPLQRPITIIMNAPIIGEESYIRSNVIPQIEAAARRGYSELALREVG